MKSWPLEVKQFLALKKWRSDNGFKCNFLFLLQQNCDCPVITSEIELEAKHNLKTTSSWYLNNWAILRTNPNGPFSPLSCLALPPISISVFQIVSKRLSFLQRWHGFQLSQGIWSSINPLNLEGFSIDRFSPASPKSSNTNPVIVLLSRQYNRSENSNQIRWGLACHRSDGLRVVRPSCEHYQLTMLPVERSNTPRLLVRNPQTMKLDFPLVCDCNVSDSWPAYSNRKVIHLFPYIDLLVKFERI